MSTSGDDHPAVLVLLALYASHGRADALELLQFMADRGDAQAVEMVHRLAAGDTDFTTTHKTRSRA